MGGCVLECDICMVQCREVTIYLCVTEGIVGN
jgi:hypothetical protein